MAKMDLRLAKSLGLPWELKTVLGAGKSNLAPENLILNLRWITKLSLLAFTKLMIHPRLAVWGKSSPSTRATRTQCLQSECHFVSCVLTQRDKISVCLPCNLIPASLFIQTHPSLYHYYTAASLPLPSELDLERSIMCRIP